MMRAVPGGLWVAAAGLWLWAALVLLPAAQWPGLPFRANDMTLDQIRLAFGLMPRGAMAVLAGAALGLAGALTTRVLRNPLADPTVLGVTSGAALALVAATLHAPLLLAAAGRGAVAMTGAAMAAGLVLMLAARRDFAPPAVAIAGMLIGLLCAGLATAMTLAQGQYLLSLVIWNGGSLVQQDWSGPARIAAVLVLATPAAALLLRPLRLLSLGAATAGMLGLRVGLVRLAGMALAVVLTAAVTAEVGVVGFVGLAAPAIVRALGLRAEGARLAATMAVGAGLLWLCDGVVLALGAALGEMFPTGALTGLIGGPLLLWMLPRAAGTVPPGQAATAMAPGVRRDRPRGLIGLLALATLAGAVCVLAIGRSPEGWMILDRASLADFLPLRLPRLVAALAAGALLAGAGALLQRLTANPLASPEVLGVSGGAALGFAGVVFLLPGAGQAMLAAGAAAGGGLVLALVTRQASRAGLPPERVLLGGLAIGALAHALLSAMMAGGDARSWVVLNWLAGSAAAAGLGTAAALAGLAMALACAAVMARRWLALVPLGPAVGQALGLPGQARAAVIVAAGLATGAATILVGPVSFVGLMAPHLARALGLMRPADHVLGAMVIGAFLMMLADTGARLATFPYDLPLGLFATLIGTPWLLALMLRRQD